ncbi:MAG: valine--tRNA ligase [Erysipelotrichaceae bacterium]|nr:valine--tRNA ligase [Erysipelotrichaceae bacterium]
MKELAKKYNHLEVEAGAYDRWVEKGYFTAGDLSKKPYSVVIPPPNVTGKLHLGHAWDNTLQDIVSRFKRMQGYDMCWLAGMDHAGIATQAKVDARLKSEGISRYDIGREKFLERAWEWKEEYAGHIRQQWGKLGNSLDYTRERFTLDEGLSKAVQKVFVDLYNEGLIYRGERIINWDPQAKTALSNIEVIHKEIEGAMYTFNYTVKETGEKLQVATTRPETMFGDVCVVVNPIDTRFSHLIGKHAINPANGEELIIIADEYIDMEFGTGAMKCTPAHDPNDFIIGEKNGFAKPICINPDGTMNELAGEYNGMDRFECRAALVKRIDGEGNLVKIEKMMHQVGHSERTDVIVEPYLSKQWFVKMKPLADDVLANQQDDDTKIHFYPNRFEKTFNQWLENIEDWCISRQLWWGHRIPAWYHNETGEVYVGLEAPVDIENWTQDEDVLDTWFSSALWPFSTWGWPEETDDFKRYYPTSLLVTGYDIIFFWVARMAFQSRHFTKSRPFKDVLIHGLIRDPLGRKMSKSLGNGVDPIDVIEQFGVDSLRFFLTTNSTPGQDLRYSEDKIKAAWNFINKIWNASRFVMMNLEGFTLEDVDLSKLSTIDTWMLGRMNQTIESVTANMERYEYAMVGNELYGFVWDDFCSWYIELAKANLQSDDETVKRGTQSTLLVVLTNILKLLHPFMPFVTEEIYSSIPHDEKEEALCISAWPETIGTTDETAVKDVAHLISIITTVRQIRVDYQKKPSEELDICLKDAQQNPEYMSNEINATLYKMCKAVCKDSLEGELLVRPIDNGTLSVSMGELVNREEELEKLTKEKEKLEKEIARSNGMLSNEKFISKAPQAKIDEEKAKLQKYEEQYRIVTERLAKMA